MRSLDLFVESNLAECCFANAAYEEAMDHYTRALGISLEILSFPYDEHDDALALLRTFALRCAERGDKKAALKAERRIANLIKKAGYEHSLNVLLETCRARFVYAREGSSAVEALYANHIAEAEQTYGVRSNEAQSQYAALMQILHDFGEIEKSLAVARERMLSLDYWNCDRLVHPVPKALRSSLHKARKVAKKQDVAAEKNEAEITKVEAKAAQHYQSGQNGDAFAGYLQAAELGSMNSQFMIGTFYQCGIGVDIDCAKAREFYALAGHRGHSVAQHYLGALLQMGLGGEVDIDAAIYWYALAADAGYGPAIKNQYGAFVSSRRQGSSVCAEIEILLRSVEAGNLDDFPVAIGRFREDVQQLVRI